MAWDHICPFGDERGDMQAGIIASVIVNALSKQGLKAVKASDFILKFKTSKPMTVKEQRRSMIAMMSSIPGVRVIKRGEPATIIPRSKIAIDPTVQQQPTLCEQQTSEQIRLVEQLLINSLEEGEVKIEDGQK